MLIGAHTLNEDSGSEQVYNGFDCCLTHEIYAKFMQNRAQAEPAYSFELALQAPVLEMMLRGFRVDPTARELGIEKVQIELKRLDYVVQTLADAVWDKGLNPNSGPQLKDFFYNHLGITPIQEWIKGELKFPMNRATLEKIENYYQARPIVNAILAHRDRTKTLSVLQTEVDPDWRMRTSYNIGGTKSARLSSSQSPTGTGTNLQNITEDLRHILIADPGYVICGIDASQSDSLFVGFMCGVLFDDWTYLDACESGDLHTAVARLVWPEFAWTGNLKKDRLLAETSFYRHYTYRDACKRIGHGANFLGKAPALAKGSHVPETLVRAFLARYFGAFPAIQRWQQWTAAELQTKHQLTSVHGRKRDFFDRTNADETLRKGLAFLAAAGTADNLDLGMYRIWQQMPEVQLLAQLHDAVYFQFRENLDPNVIVKKAQTLLTTTLTAPSGRTFIVPTDAKVGYNFGNYVSATEETPEKNPKGLRKFVAK